MAATFLQGLTLFQKVLLTYFEFEKRQYYIVLKLFHSLQSKVIVLLLRSQRINLNLFEAFEFDFMIIFLLNFAKDCIQIYVSKIALKLLLSEVFKG